jgi:hypothetical protein
MMAPLNERFEGVKLDDGDGKDGGEKGKKGVVDLQIRQDNWMDTNLLGVKE